MDDYTSNERLFRKWEGGGRVGWGVGGRGGDLHSQKHKLDDKPRYIQKI